MPKNNKALKVLIENVIKMYIPLDASLFNFMKIYLVPFTTVIVWNRDIVSLNNSITVLRVNIQLSMPDPKINGT